MSAAGEKGVALALIRYKIYAVDEGEEVLVDTTEKEEAEKHGLKIRSGGPRLVIVGRSRLIDAVEEALRDMKEGEEREFVAPPEKAYGLRDESKIIRIPVKQLRRYGIQPVVGREIEVGGNRGRIIRLTERFAYIDFNHPLAGKKLKIWIKLEKILRDPTEKAYHLVERWLGVKPVEVKFDEEKGSLEIDIPPEALSQRDLESKLTLLLRDLTDTIPEAKEIIYKFRFKISEAKDTKEEASKTNATATGEEGGKSEEESPKTR
ncbi:MAG: FKBP-type peptidyl-prolyl cis-trans isomerase [Desulfurococcales archaeon]|nr:FKBP-type peptidyl-prolyl cis-trans isomerase [Desulfurococcales archaeon]